MPQRPRRPSPRTDGSFLSRIREWRSGGGSDFPTEGLDEETSLPDPRAIDLILRVGELLLASGEGTEAVSEAMLSLSVALELPRSEVSVTFTAIALSSHPGSDQPPVTGERVVRRRSLDYFRVTELHNLVQDTALGQLELEGAIERLRAIKRARPPYANWMLVSGFGLIASSASVMMGGGILVAAVAFLATVLGDRVAAYLARRGVAEFYQLTAAACCAASIGVALLWVDSLAGLGVSAGAVIIGNIMALLPGRPLVSSLQEGISGTYVSGSARLLEVFFTLGAIVSGVGAVAYVALQLGVDMQLNQLPSASPDLTIGVLVPVLIGAAGIAMAFAVSLAVPPQILPAIGMMGILIWFIHASMRTLFDVPALLATVLGAIAIGMIGHWLARRAQRPVLPYLIPSIAPLLPGSILYRGLIELSIGDAAQGLLTLAEAVAVGLALGAGVNLGGELVRAFQRGGLAGSGRRSRPAARRTRGSY